MSGASYAQLEFIVNGYEDKYINHDEGPSAEISSPVDSNGQVVKYMYEVPTVKALSHMFWSVGMYNVNDDPAVDTFMRTNECDIYRKFSSDDIEWLDLRNAARQFIVENKSEFPTRFSFSIPLRLGDYSLKRGAFEIQEKFKIISSRRFELLASDHSSPPCVKDFGIRVGYPRAMIVEFSRPFSIEYVPVSKPIADQYLKDRKDDMKKWFDPGQRTKENAYKYRKAYLSLNIKVFAHGKFLGLHNYGFPSVQLMGILESYAIYEDIESSNLFFSQTYISNKEKGKLNVKLKEQYNILREKSKEGGILH